MDQSNNITFVRFSPLGNRVYNDTNPKGRPMRPDELTLWMAIHRVENGFTEEVNRHLVGLMVDNPAVAPQEAPADSFPCPTSSLPSPIDPGAPNA